MKAHSVQLQQNSYILNAFPSRENVQLKYYYGVDKQIFPIGEEYRSLVSSTWWGIGYIKILFDEIYLYILTKNSPARWSPGYTWCWQTSLLRLNCSVYKYWRIPLTPNYHSSTQFNMVSLLDEKSRPYWSGFMGVCQYPLSKSVSVNRLNNRLGISNQSISLGIGKFLASLGFDRIDEGTHGVDGRNIVILVQIVYGL